MSEAIPAVSLQEFLSAEEQGKLRHEFVGGRVYLHAGGTQRHDLLAGLIYGALAPGARAPGVPALLRQPDAGHARGRCLLLRRVPGVRGQR